jgi:hypothetical protein
MNPARVIILQIIVLDLYCKERRDLLGSHKTLLRPLEVTLGGGGQVLFQPIMNQCTS